MAYAFEQRLGLLQDDIATNVMVDGRWALDELALKREFHRLLDEGQVISKGTFAYVSPHPTVYRAVVDGAIRIEHKQQSFRPGDDLVFVPWILRASCPGQIGPVRISRLHSTNRLCLSCEAFPAARNLCGRSRAILYHALYPDYREEQGVPNSYPCYGKNGTSSGGTLRIKDPVCSMQVEPKTAATKLSYEGHTYYFCSIYCKKRFELDPSRYVEKDTDNPAQEHK